MHGVVINHQTRMKKRTIVAVVGGCALLGLCSVQPAVMAAGGAGNGETPKPMKIICHPHPFSFALGSENIEVFSVLVETLVPFQENSLSYQWEKSHALGPQYESWQLLNGQTNSAIILPQLNTNDVAFYRVKVQSGDVEVVSEPASLILYQVGESVNVFGPPNFTSNRSPTGCPGSYAGFVIYIKDPGWGWTAGVHPQKVQDRGSTKGSNCIEAVQFGSVTRHCAAFGSTELPLPGLTEVGSLWRFAVYFPVGGPLPGHLEPYQIYLRNFR
jgi:hypothetical protein